MDSAEAQLKLALQVLRQRWEATTALWDDAVQHDFEQVHWAPLEGQTEATRRGIDRLAQVIARARALVK